MSNKDIMGHETNEELISLIQDLFGMITSDLKDIEEYPSFIPNIHLHLEWATEAINELVERSQSENT